jgi:hypothetical protein
MTKYLSLVLQERENEFSRRISLLEQATLQTGVDIRLSTEIRADVHKKLQELVLDPHDTTAEELYHALRYKAEQDEASFRVALGMDAHKTYTSVDILQHVAKKFQPTAKKQRVWSIKRVTLKKIFTELPPTKTMKVLRYRSIPSLLKRESVVELYVLVDLIESDTYRQKLAQRLKKITNSDLEEVPLEIVSLKKSRWETVRQACRKRTTPVVAHPEVACIVVLPAELSHTNCLALLSAALILKKMQDSKVKATYLKIKSMDPAFHKRVHEVASSPVLFMTRIHDNDVDWAHIYRMQSRAGGVPEQYGPHVGEADLEWLHIEATLAALDAGLQFWVGTHRLAFCDGHNTVVSLHLIDVAFSTMYALSCQSASKTFVKEAVHNDLLERYLELPPFSRMIEEITYKLTDSEDDVLYA